MRAGAVVSVRVNPLDCQSILDLMEKVGISTHGMSFSQMVSLGLSSLLETQRVAKVLPEPDPFQFLNRMAPYRGKMRNGAKSQVTNMLYGQGDKIQAPALQLPRAEPAESLDTYGDKIAGEIFTPPVHLIEPVLSTDILLARRRLSELNARKEMADDHVPGVSWSPSDAREYDELYAQVYPHG